MFDCTISSLLPYGLSVLFG